MTENPPPQQPGDEPEPRGTRPPELASGDPAHDAPALPEPTTDEPEIDARGPDAALSGEDSRTGSHAVEPGRTPGVGWAAGAGIGIGVGVAFGVALDNLAAGLALGAGIGIALALAFGAGRR